MSVHPLATRTLASVLLLTAATAGAEPPPSSAAPPRAKTLVNARAGWREDVTYRHFQGVHSRGRWVILDAGYIDFGDPSAYRELWAGAGRVLHASDRAVFIAEGLLAQAFGPLARGETYLQPWFLFWGRLSERVETETVYLAYLPLDDAGTRQHVLDRSKLEVDLGRFKVGAGYAGLRFGGSPWQHRPFLTATVELPGASALEVWAQRLPGPDGGSRIQAQVRYSVTLTH